MKGACATLLAGLLLVSTVLDVYEVGRFLAAPSYRSREISAALRRIVPTEAAVAGDWAPFFALGTDLKALVSSEWINPLSRLTTLRPEYFLYCDTRDNRRILKRLAGVELEPAVFVSSYLGREVRLHRLRYDEKPGLETGQRGDP